MAPETLPWTGDRGTAEHRQTPALLRGSAPRGHFLLPLPPTPCLNIPDKCIFQLVISLNMSYLKFKVLSQHFCHIIQFNFVFFFFVSSYVPFVSRV